MTCDEFERVLPELEGGRNFEQQQHLRACSACSDLVADLNAITQQARLLAQEQDELQEPSPRVWNSIEIALRQEGLIRQPQSEGISLAVHRPGRRLAWLVPAFSALLLILGLLLYQNGGRPQVAKQLPPAATEAELQGPAMVPEEQQLLSLVSDRAPSLRAAYESDFRDVDTYIRDAEQSARNNPNDEIVQLHLMNAYEQRAMVYEMALNRSQP